MYAGHVGVALGIRGLRGELPAWALVLAAQGPDWIDVVLMPFIPDGERTAYWSHSIPSALVAALLLAVVARVRWRSAAAGTVAALTYLLHLPADYLTGRKPLWFGGPTIGLSLYSHPRWDFVVEVIVIALGWHLYRRSLPTSRRHHALVWALLVGLVLLQAAADHAFAVRNHRGTI